MKKNLTYKNAGVDIDKGTELVNRIKKFTVKSKRPGVISTLGGFSGLFEIPAGYKQPVLVSGTDGVGTKLKIAFETGIHDTIGWDLVAMSVNDILVSGAKPLYFLDYFATSGLDVDQAEEVIKGINDACDFCDTVLLGGETAELPGFYSQGEYDLAGFAVGIMEKSEIPDITKVKEGDIVVGLMSSGLHSNGFSLARKFFLETLNLKLTETFPGTEKSCGEVLITPTKIYVNPVLELFNAGLIKSMVHVTGGGLIDNPPRSLPNGLGMDIKLDSWPLLPVYAPIKESDMELNEMFRTFNMGLGFLMVVSPEAIVEVERILKEKNSEYYKVGKISTRSGNSETRLI